MIALLRCNNLESPRGPLLWCQSMPEGKEMSDYIIIPGPLTTRSIEDSLQIFTLLSLAWACSPKRISIEWKLDEGDEEELHALLLLQLQGSTLCIFGSILQPIHRITTETNESMNFRYWRWEKRHGCPEENSLHVHLWPTFLLSYQGYQLVIVGSFNASIEYRVAVKGTTESVSPLQRMLDIWKIRFGLRWAEKGKRYQNCMC